MLCPGDYFCVTAPDDCDEFDRFLTTGIRRFSRVNTVDGQVKYTHAGIIAGSDGTTFEALTTYRDSHLSAYKGCPIIIGRHVDMTPEKHLAALSQIRAAYQGRRYPILRLAAFMLPAMAKYVHFGKPVCSELVFIHAERAKLRQGLRTNRLIDYHWGVTPDYVADAMNLWDSFEVIFEGEF